LFLADNDDQKSVFRNALRHSDMETIIFMWTRHTENLKKDNWAIYDALSHFLKNPKDKDREMVIRYLLNCYILQK
jgi:hypothetical protein